jgi:putative transposase
LSPNPDLPTQEVMPQSLSSIYVHLVFSTKERRPFFGERPLREGLHDQLGAISKRLDCLPVRIGGVEDHVHLLCGLGRRISPADWVKELKRVSNLWLKEQGSDYARFEWQNGYAVFSVSRSNLERVRRYVAEQELHHRKLSFQDELRALLSRHELAYEERYLWD